MKILIPFDPKLFRASQARSRTNKLLQAFALYHTCFEDLWLLRTLTSQPSLDPLTTHTGPTSTQVPTSCCRLSTHIKAILHFSFHAAPQINHAAVMKAGQLSRPHSAGRSPSTHPVTPIDLINLKVYADWYGPRISQISQLNTSYDVLLQNRYRCLTGGYSEDAFLWLGNVLDTLREYRTSYDRISFNPDKDELLIYSGTYQTLITLPIQEESGRPNSPLASSIYLALTYNRLADHLHWALEALTPSDPLSISEQAEPLIAKCKPRAVDRLLIFHESRNSSPEAGRFFPIIWYYTAHLSTLVSGYHICSEIGRAWSELTEDSTAAQIDDICVSLTPLLRDYTSWEQGVRGDSALWYPPEAKAREARDFPFTPPNNNAIFIRGRAPFQDQGRSLTEFTVGIETAAQKSIRLFPSETRTLPTTAARTQSATPSLTTTTVRVMTPPVATIGVVKPAPRLLYPKISALSSPPRLPTPHSTVWTTQISLVDTRYGEPNDEFQPPDSDDEPQLNSTELNTPLIRHLTKFAHPVSRGQRRVTRQLNSLTEVNATLATSLADDRVTKLEKRIEENSRNTDSTTEMMTHVSQTLGLMTQDLVTANQAAEIAPTSLTEQGQHRELQPPILTPSTRRTCPMIADSADAHRRIPLSLILRGRVVALYPHALAAHPSMETPVVTYYHDPHGNRKTSLYTPSRRHHFGPWHRGQRHTPMDNYARSLPRQPEQDPDRLRRRRTDPVNEDYDISSDSVESHRAQLGQKRHYYHHTLFRRRVRRGTHTTVFPIRN
eukprot:gene4917-9807_t